MPFFPKDISIYAIVLAALSFVISLLSFINSRRSLMISQKDHQGRSKSVVSYLIHARTIRSEVREKYAVFNVRFTNQATLPNTLPIVELSIHYVDGNGVKREVVVQPESNPPAEAPDIKECAKAPINLPARSGAVACFIFKFPDLIKIGDIKLYNVRAVTSEGIDVSTEARIILDTVFYGKTK